MIIYLSNKHACFPSITQLGSHLFPFMYGNHYHFSKRSQMLHGFFILIEEQGVGGFVLSGLTIILSKFVAVEMIPACINIALALLFPTVLYVPFNNRVLLGCTRCCKFKDCTKILFVTMFLETSVFSTIVKPYPFYLNSIFS